MFEDESTMTDHVTRSYAMVSTYPPTQCGIATFAAALSGGRCKGIFPSWPDARRENTMVCQRHQRRNDQRLTLMRRPRSDG